MKLNLSQTAGRSKPMKPNLGQTLLGMTLLVALVGLAPAAHAGPCSQAAVAGMWGYSYTGTIILPTGPVPAAAVGRFTLDADGNLTGTQTRSVGGGVGEEVIKGSSTVNQDCTTTFKVDVYDGAGNLLRTAVLNGVYLDNATELRAIFASLVLPNGASLPIVITVDSKKVSSGDDH